jgi:hypothetical protein
MNTINVYFSLCSTLNMSKVLQNFTFIFEYVSFNYLTNTAFTAGNLQLTSSTFYFKISFKVISNAH